VSYCSEQNAKFPGAIAAAPLFFEKITHAAVA